jgi:hypothetical protein
MVGDSNQAKVHSRVAGTTIQNSIWRELILNPDYLKHIATKAPIAEAKIMSND